MSLSLKANNGFKNTEVGQIPEDWEVTQLGEIADVFRGGSPRPIERFLTLDPKGINWIKIGDVKPGAKYISSTKEKIKQSGAFYSREVRKGDFLLSNSMSFGRPYILKIDGCIHDGWLVIQNYQKTFNSDFLFYILGFESTLRQYKAMASGSSVLNLNKKIVYNLFIGYPNKKEQIRIATSISDVDELIRSLDALIAKKQAIKKGTMQQLLTGKKRLPGFSGEWEVKRLGEIVDLKNGYAFKSSSYNPNGAYSIITIANVQSGNMISVSCNKISDIPTDLQLHQRLTINDLLISMTGNVGRVCKVNIANGLLNQRVGKIIPLSIDFDFLVHHLNSSDFILEMIEKSQGGAQGNISKGDILGYEKLIPSNIEEQKSIAEILSDMDKEIQALQQKRDKYKQIKQGMMQELLTGKTRLV